MSFLQRLHRLTLPRFMRDLKPLPLFAFGMSEAEIQRWREQRLEWYAMLERILTPPAVLLGTASSTATSTGKDSIQRSASTQ